MVVLLALAACAGAPPEAGAPTFDHTHAAFAKVLDGAVTDKGMVKYQVLRSREAALDAYVASLAEVKVGSFNRSQQLAFWVNAYNAVTLAIVVDNPGIKSIKDLDGGEVWKARSFQIGGESITLDGMEHHKARSLADGRVHAVLNCASVGCPPLPPKPFRGTGVEAQLDAAAVQWVRGNAIEQKGDTVYLSSIFKWFSGDFERYRKDAVPKANEAQARGLWFAAKYADVEQGRRYTAGALNVEWAPYDWALNQAK